MALQSEVSPPIVGDPNTVKQIEGDTKSDENDPTQSTDDDVDLEDGEILDSGEEEEEEEKDFTNSSLKEALDKSCLLNIEQLVNQAKKAKTVGSPNHSKMPTPRKMNKMAANYMDHDRNENSSDHDDGWAPKFKPKFDDKTIDYRMELAAYRGTPPSSPDRKRRDEKSRKKKSSKKSKKSRKTIKRKDIKGIRVKHLKDAPRGRICKFFKEGKCVKGADCLFSHPSPTSFKKKELCKFYLNGHCNKGKDCLYMHSEFPCKFYHTGSECYARDDCRFSHAPLTDEMKRVLADYLRMSHGDDVRLNRDERDDDRGRDRDRERDRDNRKRRISHSPEPKTPPPKRTCLLGSPPRHIREAEETKLWQEEMKMLQSQNHPGFEIHLSPDRENMSPPQFAKPNFYNETLLNTPSPKRRPAPVDGPNSFHSNSIEDYNDGSPSKVYVYDENEFVEIIIPPVKQEPPDEYHWKNIQNDEENHMKSYNDNVQQEFDFTNDVKFDETTQFSEMESSIDGPSALSPDQANQSYVYNDSKDSDDISYHETNKDVSDKTSEDVNGDLSQEPLAPSIVVPSHLPRRQQELLMRVLQHQRKNAASDVTSSPSDNADIAIKKEEPEEEVEVKSESIASDTKWYSSEDDDDDCDQPLTDVLKKIQQAPPAKPQVQENRPQVNILDMFNKIQQKTMENKSLSKPSSSSQPSNAFWANILQGTAPKPASLAPNHVGEPKRRTLLPDPIMPLKKVEPPTPKEPAIIKDPRLKNRDPRKLASASNLALNISKSSIDGNVSDSSPSLQDALFSKPLGSVTGEPTKENIPYRLRGICANPPNYTPYLSASQSNPNLLKDPRLRKHLIPSSADESIRNGKDHEVIKPAPPKDVPPIPELLLKYQKPSSVINIFESSSSSKRPAETTPVESKLSLSILSPKACDPRKRRNSRSNSSSSSDTPPHLTIVDSVTTPPPQEFKTAPILENAIAEPAMEKKWLPPVLEKSWTPLTLEKSWTSLPIKEEPVSDSESNDPPKLDIGKDCTPKKSPSPPLKEEFITVIKTEVTQDSNNDSHPVVPPLIIKKIKPTIASHLPRAIADPRMAKLHHRVEPRRHRLTAADAKSIVERKKQPLRTEKFQALKETLPESKNLDIPKFMVEQSEKTGEKDEKSIKGKAVKDEKVKATKSIPKKRRLSDKGEEKKKPVHRNRKSSMDYASPLNSCDATNINNSLDYNSYNQRPKRTATEKPPTADAAPSLPELSDTSSIPDFVLSDNSNLECDNSNDVNLKDRFKTIDPTASPFC